MLYAGGSFGRRANPKADYVVEAVAIAKAANVTVPVKMVWTREEDTRAGYYRPLYVHSLKAGLDKAGKLIAWQHRIVGQSIMAGTAIAGPGPIDQSVEGASNLPYTFRTLPSNCTRLRSRCRFSGGDPSVRPTRRSRRNVSSTTSHATRSRIRMRCVGSCCRKSIRGTTPCSIWSRRNRVGSSRAPKDEVWGLALHESFNSVVAQVAQLKRTSNGLRLAKVICAVDCGIAVNPNIVAMQMEGGIGYGLAAALTGAITLKDGVVEQGNFDDYRCCA